MTKPMTMWLEYAACKGKKGKAIPVTGREGP
jgi:hypothetical protein